MASPLVRSRRDGGGFPISKAQKDNAQIRERQAHTHTYERECLTSGETSNEHYYVNFMTRHLLKYVNIVK